MNTKCSSKLIFPFPQLPAICVKGTVVGRRAPPPYALSQMAWGTATMEVGQLSLLSDPFVSAKTLLVEEKES